MKEELKKMFTEHWTYLAINAACELGLFDKIENKEDSVGILCMKNGWNEKSLSLLLAICDKEGVLENKNPIRLTEKGRYLTSGHPESLLNACMHWAGEHMTAWQNLSCTIKTGDSVFENIYKKPFFDYIGKKTDKLIAYHRAMKEYARDDYRDICSKIDFSVFKSVMDAGGGHGALISNIKQQYPGVNCYLFDLPEVVNTSSIDESINLIPGDFFVRIHPSADAIILSRILHDWSDQKVLQILKNCTDALNPAGNIFIIENLADRMPDNAAILSLNMMAVCNSFERTENEYRELLTKSGLGITDICQLNSLQYILKTRKI